MIKRTLLFSNPAYLSTKNEQLVIRYPIDGHSEQGEHRWKLKIDRFGIITEMKPSYTS